MQGENNLKKPLVSFIITYHNEPVKLLRECLDSIFALSLSNTEREIILVDDGSDEYPLNSLVEYRDSIIYLRQPNSGVSAARNKGITMSTGEFIQFVDADDCIIPSGYEHCLDVVRFKNPDIVLFNFTQEGTDVDTPYFFDGPVTGSEYMRKNNLKASVCSYIFRKKSIINLRFTEGIEFGEDEEFTAQLILRTEKVYSTETCAYYYRKRENSVTNDTSTRSYIKRLNDTEHVIFYLGELASTLPNNEKIALQRRVAQLTMDYLYNTIMLTHSKSQLDERIERLRKQGLFPLPSREYTKKYKLFSKLVNSNTGRRILLYALPFINPKP